MFEALSRGVKLTKASFQVLRQDKEMLVLPFMAGVIMLLAVVGFGYGIIYNFGTSGPGLLLLFLVYVLAYGIVFFFNAAVIEMATIRFNGGTPTIGAGLSKSWSRVGRILQWAFVAATIGLLFAILRNIARNQDSPVGRIVASIMVSIAETAWNVATFFVIPIAIYQDLGPISAIKASTGAMKRTFGESIAGIATTGIVFLVLGILGALPLYIGVNLLMGGAFGAGVALIAIAVTYWVILAAVNSAVNGILVAALYKYSIEGQLPTAYAQTGIRADSLAW